jgi:hypothetical protein
MRIVIIILSVSLVSFNFIRTNTIHENQEPTIYLDSLTKISLPISKTCGEISEVYDFSYNNKAINDLPENLKFGGLVKKTDNYFAVILMDPYADFQLHYLTTVTLDGNIIETFELFSAGCSEDPYYWGQSNYTIDNNLNIFQTDSSATYSRDDNGTILKESIVSTSHRYSFYVDEYGKIMNILRDDRN